MIIKIEKIQHLMGFFLILFTVSLVQAEEQKTRMVTEQAMPETARQVVEQFQSVLLDVMKQGQALGFQGRFDKLAPAITQSHDLTKIARIAVGREWKKLADDQQQELVDQFIKMSISAYAYNFKAYDNELFEFVSQEETARGGIIIHSLFKIPDDKDVKFDYMMKKKGDSWKIINVIANGVSDLALRRSEYTSMLKRQGFEALIAKIIEKTENYAK